MGGQVTLLRHGEIMDGKEALPLLQKGALLPSFCWLFQITRQAS